MKVRTGFLRYAVLCKCTNMTLSTFCFVLLCTLYCLYTKNLEFGVSLPSRVQPRSMATNLPRLGDPHSRGDEEFERLSVMLDSSRMDLTCFFNPITMQPGKTRNLQHTVAEKRTAFDPELPPSA